MEQNINLNTREVTFNDVAVHELAQGRAECLCALQFGRCTKEQCHTCSTFIQFRNCVAHMSDYDKLRLNTNTAAIYRKLSLYPARFMSYDKLKSHTCFWVILLGVFLLLLVLLVGCRQPPSQLQNYTYVSYENIDCVGSVLNDSIWEVLNYVSDNVEDFNKDGKVNCIDYAVLFKLCFDASNNNKDLVCIIVWNYNPPKLNHLFCIIYDRSSMAYIEVEPRKYPGKHWEFRHSWELADPGCYDPRYNNYDTTEKWLREGGF